jgi:hypothetical protein
VSVICNGGTTAISSLGITIGSRMFVISVSWIGCVCVGILESVGVGVVTSGTGLAPKPLIDPQSSRMITPNPMTPSPPKPRINNGDLGAGLGWPCLPNGAG